MLCGMLVAQAWWCIVRQMALRFMQGTQALQMHAQFEHTWDVHPLADADLSIRGVLEAAYHTVSFIS